jgi:ribosomal protein RSM22 (predicted rRNA methylase)
VLSSLYPPEIETWWLQQALTRFNLKSDQAALKLLAPYAQKLSQAFTSERATQSEDFQSLYESKQNQLAYGIYFFPQTYVRTLFPLQELIHFRQWTPSRSDIHLLDLGSGAGAAGFAASRTLQEAFPNQRLHLTLVDQEKHLLHLGENLCRDALSPHSPKLSLSKHCADFTQISSWKPSGQAKWDLITISFSLNEAFSGKSSENLLPWLHELKSCLKPGGILLILEPSLKESSLRLETLRNLIANSDDWRIWGPCLHHQTCPLLAEGKYWCHEVRRWRLPRTVQMINQHLRLTPEELKFSFLLLGQKAAPSVPPSATSFRMIAPMSAQHGKLLTRGCNSQGEAAEYDLLTRHLDRAQIRSLNQLERGSLVQGEELKSLGGPFQYRLSSLTPLRLNPANPETEPQ